MSRLVYLTTSSAAIYSMWHGGTCSPTFTNGWARGRHRE